MSTSNDEIYIDLDEIDRKAAEKAAKKPPPADVEVVHAEPPEKAPEKPIVTADEGIEKVKKQLADERTAREDAERRAADAENAELRARTESQDTNLHLLTTAIEKAEQQKVVLKANLKQAIADGDPDAQVEIQDQMADVAASLLQLKQGKSALEKAPKPQPRPQTDIVEKFVENMTPKSADWIRAHRDCVTDPRKNAKMIAAHNFIKDDVVVDSDEYFEKIEEMLGLKAASTETEMEEDPMAEAAKPTRKAAPAAAPVTRSGNGAGNRTNVVTLTAAQREIAALNGQTDEEYARNLVALRKEGRVN